MRNPELVEQIRTTGAWAFESEHELIAHYYLARAHHTRMCVSICFQSTADLNEVDIQPVFGKCPDCERLERTVLQERRAVKS